MLPENKPTFKVDENLPITVADILVEAGYDTHTVYQEQVQGLPDAGIAKSCREESRILITLDLDFSDIHAYPPHESPGFVVLRLRSHSISHISAVIRRILDMIATEQLLNRTWIVEENRIRFYGDVQE
jgi:predicted nuclease of predicted toxin-antitoxin system